METKMIRPEFLQKIKKRMDDENLGIRDLAKKLGVSHPTVTEIVTYGKRPSFDTCVALAKWLNQSTVSVLIEAGLLSQPPGADPWVDEQKQVISELTGTRRNIAERLLQGLLDEERAAKYETNPRPANAAKNI